VVQIYKHTTTHKLITVQGQVFIEDSGFGVQCCCSVQEHTYHRAHNRKFILGLCREDICNREAVLLKQEAFGLFSLEKQRLQEDLIVAFH